MAGGKEGNKEEKERKIFQLTWEIPYVVLLLLYKSWEYGFKRG